MIPGIPHTKLGDLFERMNECFGYPWMPKGFFEVKKQTDKTFLVKIGDRFMHVGKLGENIGARTRDEEDKSWEIKERPHHEHPR